jgi:DNA-binding MarR family transcriptional regulator
MPPESAVLSPADYCALGEFRYRIRCFLQFSESATRAEGMEPQQHQLLLAVRALEHADGPTIGALADHLLIRHHSAVGLIDRMAERGLVERVPGTQDRRQVKVKLTAQGETKLRRLSEIHREELRHSGPTLVAALSSILGHLYIQEQDVIPRRET